MDNSVYPWQEHDYTYLKRLSKRRPHAILLYGHGGGLITLKLALHWIYGILCNDVQNNGEYCKKCNSCILLDNGNHPDFYKLTPDEDEKTISVASIRKVTDFLALSTHISNYKIILIEDTRLLNSNSANALLKTLEEPSNSTLFVLLSNNLWQNLPTIISRCHKYRVSPPNNIATNSELFEPEIEQQQLELFIKTLCEPSVIGIYNLTVEFDGKTISYLFILEFITKWLSDLISYKSSGEFAYFKQYADLIKPLISKLQIKKAFYLHDKLNFLIKWANHPLNYKLQIENFLFQYQQIFIK